MLNENIYLFMNIKKTRNNSNMHILCYYIINVMICVKRIKVYDYFDFSFIFLCLFNHCYEQ